MMNKGIFAILVSLFLMTSLSAQEYKVGTYNIYTSADGYVGQFNMDIPVFSGVTSLQSVDLILQSAAGDNTTPKVVEEAPQFTL